MPSDCATERVTLVCRLLRRFALCHESFRLGDGCGTLLVSGQDSTHSGTGTTPVSVSAGGTLSGNGRISGDVTVANGSTAVLYPHISGGGALTLGGNLTVGSSSLVKFDLSTSHSSGNDQVVMNGSSKTLTTGGATITINPAGTLDIGGDYTLIDAGSGNTISGTFSTDLPFLLRAYSSRNFTAKP